MFLREVQKKITKKKIVNYNNFDYYLAISSEFINYSLFSLVNISVEKGTFLYSM